MLLLLGALLASLTSTAAPEGRRDDALSASLGARVALGSEWDTNARRAVKESDGGSTPGDGVARLVVDARSRLGVLQAHVLELDYVLGTKRFFRQASEDLLVHDLSLGTDHLFTPFFSASTSASLRASRMRSGARDYTLATVRASLAIHPLDILSASVDARLTRFAFRPDHHLSYRGPSLGVELSVRPLERLSLSGTFEHTLRGYRGNALVLASVPSSGEQVDVLTYCDGSGDGLSPPACSPRSRDDEESAVALRATYRSVARISGEYLLRIQRSSSDFENIDRHRVFVHVAFPLPFELTANISASLQVTSGVSITDSMFLAEDDENQNSITAQLARRLSDTFSVEVRYALFANQFSTADVGFFRQIFYLGLSYRTAD